MSSGAGALAGAAAGCVRLEASSLEEVLTIRFDPARVGPDVAAAFPAAGSPWFLAISGEKGRFSAATVVEVVNSPVFSPPGPS